MSERKKKTLDVPDSLFRICTQEAIEFENEMWEAGKAGITSIEVFDRLRKKGNKELLAYEEAGGIHKWSSRLVETAINNAVRLLRDWGLMRRDLKRGTWGLTDKGGAVARSPNPGRYLNESSSASVVVTEATISEKPPETVSVKGPPTLLELSRSTPSEEALVVVGDDNPWVIRTTMKEAHMKASEVMFGSQTQKQIEVWTRRVFRR